MHKPPCETDETRRAAARPSRTRCLALALALAMGISALPGCTVWQQARRTIWYEPIAYPWKVDRQRSLKAYRSWAEQSWQNESGACPNGPPSKHYELGFKDGFVDFIYAGGDGQPPPVPPRKYWNLSWRSPQGHSAADEWFAGYRHGAKVARAGGYRNLGVVYSSMRSNGRPAMREPLLLGPPQAMSEDLGPPGEVLPAPAVTKPDVPSELGKQPATGELGPAAADAKAPAPAAEQGVPRQAAPMLGPPALETDDAKETGSADVPPAAESAPSLEVPPPPTPPAQENVEEPSPFDPEPAVKPQGAAMMFRRAISAAAGNMQTNPPAPLAPGLMQPTSVAAASSAQSPPKRDAGPPPWPDPALGAKADSPNGVVAASAVEAAVGSSVAPHSNILRHPKK